MSESTNQATASIDQAANVNVSLKERIFYAMGAIGLIVPFNLTGSYLNFYWTDVIMIPAGIVGTFLMVNKLWDALNDPLEGAIFDRFRFKKGRYRQWLPFGALFSSVLCLMLFVKLPNVSMNTQLIFTFSVYFLYVVGFTMLEVPHMGMLSTITTNYKARGILTSWRQTATSGTMTLISAIFLPLALYFGKGDRANGYFWTVLLLLVCSLPFYAVCYFGVKERVIPPREDIKVPFIESFKCLKGNTPALMLMVCMLSWGIASAFSGSARMYFWTYVANNTGLFAVNTTIRQGGGIFANMLVGVLVKFFRNKRNFAIVAWMLCAIMYFIMGFVSVDTTGGQYAFHVLSFLQGFFGQIGFTSLFALIPDVTEHTMLNYGLRASGFIFAIVNLCFKFGQSFCQGIFSWLLGSMNYAPGVAQPENVINLLKMSVSFIPCAGTIVGIIGYAFYKLNQDTHEAALRKISGE